MIVGDSLAVLELFSKSPTAIVHASSLLTRGIGLSATEKGLCRSQPTVQAQLAIAGVKVQNTLLPGEVVS